jgi:signal transduction histidine kinase
MRPIQVRASILLKGLALVAIPLICELGFVAVLLHMQDEALKVAREEAQAHQLSDSVHQVMANAMAITLALRGYSLGHLKESEVERHRAFRNMFAALASLKQQVGSDPKAQAVITRSEEGAHDIEAAVNEIKVAVLSGESTLDETLKLTRRRIDEAAAKMVSPELLQLARESDKNSKVLEESQSQAQVRSITLNLILVSTALSIAMALYFSREIAGRINEVSRNANRFSMGQPLGEPLSGEDEIAQLDDVFRQMAEMLESAMVKQQAVFDNAIDMICTLDRGLVVKSVNPACGALLGRSEDELLGSRIVTFIAESERSSFAEEIGKLISGGNPVSDRNVVSGSNPVSDRNVVSDSNPLSNSNPISDRKVVSGSNLGQIPTQMISQSGPPIDVECSAHWSKSEQSFFCVFHDISALKAAERLRQDVVNMVTHDIRSPLNAVMNFEEMLGTGSLGQLNERGMRLLDLSKRSNFTINVLVSDLLDIEKIRAGQLSLSPKKFVIADCIDKCVQSLAVWAEQQQVTILIDSCDAFVIADENRIGQVITNLISNGIKFSEQNKRVMIKARVNGPWLTVAVLDEGPGIPAEEIGLIFERFRQGSSKKAHLGSGLGLSICKALVELHGGTIFAESMLGKGSTFSFKIPIS